MELHADFIAGWVLAQHPVPHEDGPARTLFELGDTDFKNPAHHGQPELRAAMVRAGFDSGKLDLNAAFRRAKTYANLK